MERYIHLFNNKESHDEIYNSETLYNEPWTGYINETLETTYNKIIYSDALIVYVGNGGTNRITTMTIDFYNNLTSKEREQLLKSNPWSFWSLTEQSLNEDIIKDNKLIKAAMIQDILPGEKEYTFDIQLQYKNYDRTFSDLKLQKVSDKKYSTTFDVNSPIYDTDLPLTVTLTTISHGFNIHSYNTTLNYVGRFMFMST